MIYKYRCTLYDIEKGNLIIRDLVLIKQKQNFNAFGRFKYPNKNTSFNKSGFFLENTLSPCTHPISKNLEDGNVSILSHPKIMYSSFVDSNFLDSHSPP